MSWNFMEPIHTHLMNQKPWYSIMSTYVATSSYGPGTMHNSWLKAACISVIGRHIRQGNSSQPLRRYYLQQKDSASSRDRRQGCGYLSRRPRWIGRRLAHMNGELTYSSNKASNLQNLQNFQNFPPSTMAEDSGSWLCIYLTARRGAS